MPVATTLPVKNVVIRYPPPPPTDEVEEGYQLLELPAETLKALEKSNEPIRSVLTVHPRVPAISLMNTMFTLWYPLSSLRVDHLLEVCEGKLLIWDL